MRVLHELRSILKIDTEIDDGAVIPRKPDGSELYMRLLSYTDKGSYMPLGQEKLNAEHTTERNRSLQEQKRSGTLQ